MPDEVLVSNVLWVDMCSTVVVPHVCMYTLASVSEHFGHLINWITSLTEFASLTEFVHLVIQGHLVNELP